VLNLPENLVMDMGRAVYSVGTARPNHYTYAKEAHDGNTRHSQDG